jgi:hypothetical protein
VRVRAQQIVRKIVEDYPHSKGKYLLAGSVAFAAEVRGKATTSKMRRPGIPGHSLNPAVPRV